MIYKWTNNWLCVYFQIIVKAHILTFYSTFYKHVEAPRKIYMYKKADMDGLHDHRARYSFL